MVVPPNDYWMSAYPDTIISEFFVKKITHFERIILKRVECEKGLSVKRFGGCLSAFYYLCLMIIEIFLHITEKTELFSTLSMVESSVFLG